MIKRRGVVVLVCVSMLALMGRLAHAQSPPVDPGSPFKNPFQRDATKRAPTPAKKTVRQREEQFEFKPVEIHEDDDELKKLLKARYNAAVAEVQARRMEYLRGMAAVNQICEAGKRVLIAERELLSDPQALLKSYDRSIVLAKEIEKYAEANLSVGTGTKQEVFQARYYRLEAEIERLKFRRSLKAAEKPDASGESTESGEKNGTGKETDRPPRQTPAPICS